MFSAYLDLPWTTCIPRVNPHNPAAPRRPQARAAGASGEHRTEGGLELGVGYEYSERRSLVTKITRDELTAVAKAFEAVVLVTDEDDFEAED